MAELKILSQAQDVNDHFLRLAVDCVESWFSYEPRIPIEDFVDRFAVEYLNPEGWDIESYYCPATNKLLKHARAALKDFQ
jgi:hypothetical protein